MPNELNTRSERVAEEIRAEMARQQISVDALSEKSGIPISTLRRSVKGQRPFTITELFVITRLLGISVVEIIQRAEGRLAA
ncbi:helix-turn-helix transcriptional regulator [Corynebacterium tuberculostearicum]|uniref:helix-turn-helix domain-containing protein n=1 Tax=Corynebacterium tuberculostearicum TaxID=38304 RepID=UPI0026652A99|nr:helix-turn-helix transcriptional regulator [Corynebacterium tuberculostearicum]WKE50371.1 helix-turn-helix transcriptional regulator [Corynebacterium tuberculostearicum]